MRWEIMGEKAVGILSSGIVALVLIFVKLMYALGSEISVQCVRDVDCSPGLNVQNSL